MRNARNPRFHKEGLKALQLRAQVVHPCVAAGLAQLPLTVDGTDHILRAGGFHQVEPNQPHRFHNSGDAPASMINISQPGGHGDFFRAAHALLESGRFTPENAAAMSREYGIEILGAP